MGQCATTKAVPIRGDTPTPKSRPPPLRSWPTPEDTSTAVLRSRLTRRLAFLGFNPARAAMLDRAVEWQAPPPLVPSRPKVEELAMYFIVDARLPAFDAAHAPDEPVSPRPRAPSTPDRPSGGKRACVCPSTAGSEAPTLGVASESRPMATSGDSDTASLLHFAEESGGEFSQGFAAESCTLPAGATAPPSPVHLDDSAVIPTASLEEDQQQ